MASPLEGPLCGRLSTTDAPKTISYWEDRLSPRFRNLRGRGVKENVTQRILVVGADDSA